MAQPNTPMLITPKSQSAVIEFAAQCHNANQSQWNTREQMRKIDLAYIREADLSTEHQRAKIANRYGDKSRFQNITVPVVMPMVESAVTYQSAVFLQGQPIFGVVSNPQNIDAALQMETIIDNQATIGGWVRQLILAFRDGFKYNLMAVEVTWNQKTVASLETNLSYSLTQAKPKESIWEGNTLERLDPYNLIYDMRVPLPEVHVRGDYAGYTKLMSRIGLKSFIASLPMHLKDNVKAAFESGLGESSSSYGVESFYTPQINSGALAQVDPKISFNWESWAGIAGIDSKIKYRDIYEVTTLYARILPSDFLLSVPARNTPQIWKFIIVNHRVIIYAERCTNAHDYLHIIFGQPLEDGLGLQTKSLATNVEPVQDITSAMWNSVIAARRRAISDRGIYDPSRITSAHINNDNPSAKIPVRPAAYGKPVADAYYPIPFRDDQSGLLMQETQQLIQMGNLISGQNPVRQGQFVKGNKTQHEFQSVMSNANGRDQLTAMMLESQFFTPIKEILKINVLQYQGGATLYNKEMQQSVEIDPIALRKTVMEFKVSDGLIPTDKLIHADTMQTALQVIGSSPQIASRYNLGPLFSYFIKTQGGRISEFEKSPEQIAYEEALAQWQQVVLQAMKANPQIQAAQLPPQPTPQQYNYQPQGGASTPPGVKTTQNVNNITNNITDNRGTQP